MIQIKRHENRKLYVPGLARYTNYEEIKKLVQSGEVITVTDDVTGEDITSFIMAKVLSLTGKVPAEKLMELIRRGE